MVQYQDNFGVLEVWSSRRNLYFTLDLIRRGVLCII
jgi:hypothetical protein